MLQADGTPPEKCTPDIMRIVVQQHLSCPSVWAIFPIQVGCQRSTRNLTFKFLEQSCQPLDVGCVLIGVGGEGKFFRP
eukprot:238646-Chlamydomonas_euryale.AAC.1